MEFVNKLRHALGGIAPISNLDSILLLSRRETVDVINLFKPVTGI